MCSAICKNYDRSIGDTDSEQVLNLHAMNGSDSEFYGCLQKRELWVEVDWWNKIQAGCL